MNNYQNHLHCVRIEYAHSKYQAHLENCIMMRGKNNSFSLSLFENIKYFIKIFTRTNRLRSK